MKYRFVQNFDEGGFTEPFNSGYDLLKVDFLEHYEDCKDHYCDTDHYLVNMVIEGHDKPGSDCERLFTELLEEYINGSFFVG